MGASLLLPRKRECCLGVLAVASACAHSMAAQGQARQGGADHGHKKEALQIWGLELVPLCASLVLPPCTSAKDVCVSPCVSFACDALSCSVRLIPGRGPTELGRSHQRQYLHSDLISRTHAAVEWKRASAGGRLELTLTAVGLAVVRYSHVGGFPNTLHS